MARGGGTPLGAYRGPNRRRALTPVQQSHLERLEWYAEPSLFPLAPKFHGPDLTDDDQQRLTAQQQKLVDLMGDGQWRTLRMISHLTNIPEASASAQLRHLRNSHGYRVDRVHIGNGLYDYRLTREEHRRGDHP